MDSTESLIDVRDLIWKGKQYKYHLLLPILLVLCGAFIFYKVTVPVYESYVILSVGDRGNVSPTIDALTRGGDAAAPRDRVALLANRVHSRAFLEELIQRTGLLASLQAQAKRPDRRAEAEHRGVSAEEYLVRQALTNVGRRIGVAPVQGNLIRITVQAADPIEARDLVATTSDLLLQQSLQATLERVQARSVFSEDQIAVYQERLRRSEDGLRQYNESLLGRGLQASVINEGNLDVARNLLHVNEEEMEQISSRIRSERAAWDAETGGGLLPPDLDTEVSNGMGRRLADLEVSLSDASLGGERGVAEAGSLRSKIGDLRQGLLGEFEKAASTIAEVSEPAKSAAAGISLDRALLRSLKAKSSRLQGQIQNFTQRVRSSPRDQMEMQRLQGDVDANRQMLATLQKEVTSSQISEALATSDLGVKIDVIEAAQVPLYPVFPSRIKIFGGALLLGPLLSIGLVLAVEKLGAVVQTVEQAEREFGVRVIGTVPRVEGWGQPGSFLQNHWPAVSIVVVLLLTGILYTINSVLRTEPAAPKAPATTKSQPQ